MRLAVLALAAVALVAWGVSVALDRLLRAPREAAAPPAPPEAPASAHITATLFYVDGDGTMLVPFRREVTLGQGTVEQGRRILLAQLRDAPPEGLVNPVPDGTSLRAFFVTGTGDAFVDLSAEAASNHPGGSQSELLTVYAVIHAVTDNLPAVRRVQILVNGHEVDTLAGHVDLRQPLAPDPTLVRDPGAPPSAAADTRSAPPPAGPTATP